MADFGFASKLPENGMMSRILGTERYMAPEMFIN